ncbi:DUF1877 family protein [Embleya sp. AB8]|uniref:DUF1877 family protein n=1 Tax=Embleya sp. AB8 TaxID=3156304 RepID=UPI003C724B22
MGVQFYWHRVPETDLTVRSPNELDAAISAEADRYEGSEKLLMLQNLDVYMHFALVHGRPDGPGEDLIVYNGEQRTEGVEDPDYGFVGAEVFVQTAADVRTSAESVRGLPFDTWIHAWDAELIEAARFFGAGGEWEAGRSERLVEALNELRDFYEAATAAGEAIVTKAVA